MSRMPWVLLFPLLISAFLLDVSPSVCKPIVQLPQVHARIVSQQVFLLLGGVRVVGVSVNPLYQDARIAADLLIAAAAGERRFYLARRSVLRHR